MVTKLSSLTALSNVLVARNGLWSAGHPYVCIIQALVIANYKLTSFYEYH